VAEDNPAKPVAADPAPSPPAHDPGRRKRLFLILAGVVITAALLAGLWYVIVARGRVSTENAYVGADVAQVMPRVSGSVIEVAVQDTRAVKAGDVLVRLDDADARIALARAEAELLAAQRQFRQRSATGQALAARVTAREADISGARAQLAVAQANFDRARVDFERRQKLAATGAVSGDELTSATNAFATARANLTLARAQVEQANSTRGSAAGEAAANQALTSGTTAENNPDVLAARAQRDQARLDLERTVIRAPIAGIVTRRQVQVGQRVAAGTPLMTIVPVDKLYVDANFKEGQLARVRPGQPVELESDLYGGDVVYHGRVVGLSGGTGAAFALIPAQNATGNWIKVVQRLPVRIEVDPAELRAHPLRVGLSMDVSVDVSGS
jgi:membrane fusion protein (multidrug efflux system)